MRPLKAGNRVRLKGFANNGADCDGAMGALLRPSSAVAHAWWVDTKAFGEVLLKASQCRLTKPRERRRVWIRTCDVPTGVNGVQIFVSAGEMAGGAWTCFVEARPERKPHEPARAFKQSP